MYIVETQSGLNVGLMARVCVQQKKRNQIINVGALHRSWIIRQAAGERGVDPLADRILQGSRKMAIL